VANLVTLCRFHHRKVHEGQVIVQVLDDGAIRFAQPDGECFETESRTLGDWQQLPAVHERVGIHIDAQTAAMRGRGGPMDYGLAMDALMYLRRHDPCTAANSPWASGCSATTSTELWALQRSAK
jgi:hypothetical protein